MHIMTERGWRRIHRLADNHNAVQGVFIAKSLEENREVTSKRCDAYCKLVQEGDLQGMAFFVNTPMQGAFGERI